MPAQRADPAFDEAGRPSKTQRKRDSHDLQALGEAVAALPAARLGALELPDTLREALHEWRRTRSHEGQRRQMQFIGKLMRGVDPAPLREAVAESQLGGARQSLALHEAERWRHALITDDAALTPWVAQHPDTDVAHLRGLIRQARDTALPDEAPGAATRQSRACRTLFQYVKSQLQATP
jgi:ribosome-associated protein